MTASVRRLLADTVGPTNRYRTILFIEKEGFSALLERAQIAERFDVAIMSTKGMSVTASRLLLDRLAPHYDNVLVAHDFDRPGFSIFGTLGTDGRRYRFDNKVNVIDIGLRQTDVEEMRLEAEPFPCNDKDPDRTQETLRRHGATEREIAFLMEKRVELNAMPADVFIQWLERKLRQHGCEKVIPDDNAVLERHARQISWRSC
jgi:DNA topoisomerase VI subunit A